MRRSICLTQPQVVQAGETGLFKFSYTTSLPLSKGATLRFDMCTHGRSQDWMIPSTDLKRASNVIWATIGDGKPLAAKALNLPGRSSPLFEFILPQEMKIGQTIHFNIGSPAKSDPKKNGNTCQSFVQRRKPFSLLVSPKGDGRYEEPELFTLDVRGNKLENIRVITPSFASRGKRFDIIIRFEDRFGNLTGNAPEGTTFELSYEHLRENLKWKLFVPETGFVNLPNLYFNEEGIFRIQLKNLQTGEAFNSAPIKCFQDAPGHLFWGLLHGESDRVDSAESIETALRHFRDEQAINFFATSPFEAEEETPQELWRHIGAQVTEFNEDDRFITCLGLQWKGKSPAEGLRQILFAKDNKPLIRVADAKTSSLQRIYKAFSPKDLTSIPEFTMGGPAGWNFDGFNSQFERVVEIYNAWGSSECTKAQGNPRPITGSGKKAYAEYAKGSVISALNRGFRFGFVAGGLDDRGVFEPLFEANQTQYSPGLTAIIAKEHTRDSLLDALFNRNCYATTGARIVLGLSIAGEGLGKELSTKAKPGLAISRYITGFVAGTTGLKKVELIRSGEVLKTWTVKGSNLDFELDDCDDIADFSLKSEDEGKSFTYYYLRVLQEDKHMAWSSPIWIDFDQEAPAKKKKK